MAKINNCPRCNEENPWLVRVHPFRWIFTKYYVGCRRCNWCGKRKIGKRKAIRAWNKEIIYGD